MTETGEGSANDAEIAYQAFAPAYDAFTAHHDYEIWLGGLISVLESHGLRGDRLLDLGCGTGKSFLPMLDKGWSVTACDISAAMLAIAREKADGRAELLLADVRELPRLGEFDLAWALDDIVNYQLSEAEVARAFAAIRPNLAPHGLLLFDANTLSTYRTFFAEHSEQELPEQGWRMVWDGRASADQEPETISEAVFELRSLEDGRLLAEPARHRQRHYPEPVLRALLERSGYEVLGVWGHDESGIPEQPFDEPAHSKALYVARPA